MSRRERLAARGPYVAAVPGPIAHAMPQISHEVLALVDDASRELARFDAEAGDVAAPFASILLRSESASSSEIERITSSAKQLALAEIGASRSANAKLVAANVQAMHAAIDLAGRLDADSIIAMHRALLGDSEPHMVGRWRTEQVWIGGGARSPHSATFVPPHHDRVPALMEDLVAFLQRTDLPVLITAALAHAQFETIHPFPDGNGRTGRALIHGVLHAGGLVTNMTIPVSAGLLARTDEYFGALTAYREAEVEPIIARLAEASFEAVGTGRRLVADLREMRGEWVERVRPRAGSAVEAMLDLVIRQPVLSVALAAESLGVSVVSATSAIERLEDAGVLERANSGRRNRLWQASEVLAALDDFAAQARRRP
ncbi:MAG: Fic family protein [Propionibacterium sp.]|nr:Fic family protein [Propionibacterium sp.]